MGFWALPPGLNQHRTAPRRASVPRWRDQELEHRRIGHQSICQPRRGARSAKPAGAAVRLASGGGRALAVWTRSETTLGRRRICEPRNMSLPAPAGHLHAPGEADTTSMPALSYRPPGDRGVLCSFTCIGNAQGAEDGARLALHAFLPVTPGVPRCPSSMKSCPPMSR